MPEIRLPIVVNDSGDVSLFTSVEAAERFLEPEDVGNGEVFDAEGRVLVSTVIRHVLAKRVRLGLSDQVLPDRLRHVLSSYLGAFGHGYQKPLDEWPLDELLVEVAMRQTPGSGQEN